ncbi:MAG TPA: DUF547 domain-containing protein [Thermoanaerobaculia bacterium]|nr:DUF547 domain-containing protein [Thermoanaerobaculia bacterium]
MRPTHHAFSTAMRGSFRLTAATLASSLALLLALASCAPPSEAAGGELGEAVRTSIDSGSATFDHTVWDRLLAGGTRDGLVDYRYFAERRGELDGYLERVAEAPLAELSASHLEALLINAYNAYTIVSILDHPNVASIRDISGVWDKLTHRVGGFDVTLDAIEHQLLRPYFKDPRIHVAVNCASMSCAPLPPWAFSGEHLDQQLEDWTRRFFASPKFLLLEDEKLSVSKLLEWYGNDFTASDANPRADTLQAFIARYGPDDVRSFVERYTARHGAPPPLAFLDYDWSLNQAPAR